MQPPTLSSLIPEGPILEAGTWVWKARLGDVEVRFTGRGPEGERAEVLRRIEPSAPPLAWAKQIHSATVLQAHSGFCGEGDALVTDEAGLALSVITADCVPVLVAGPEGLASIHAGWRGIAGRIIPAALARMKGRPDEWTAWIGPTIGACCYEVGEEVAESVVAASSPGVAIPGPNGKPHLDLPEAARLQLLESGVGQVFTVAHCTRCNEETLWSYRREGKHAGRNLGLIWRRAAAS
jgi:YfiH family protein